MGDLIKAPHSEINATLELLDRQGVTGENFAELRRASLWEQSIVGRIFDLKSKIWSILGIEATTEKIGFTKADFLALGDEDKCKQILSFLRGRSEIKLIEHLIDCDADPFVPDGWSVVEHKKSGLVKFDPAKIYPYLSKKQKKRPIEGNKLREELKNMRNANANVLDFLLKNPHLIPEEWKGKYVFFWGTIYRSSDGHLCVRYLSWGGVRWDWHYDWLDDDWHDVSPAALLAS
jgi:hypothetical protein